MEKKDSTKVTRNKNLSHKEGFGNKKSNDVRDNETDEIDNTEGPQPFDLRTSEFITGPREINCHGLLPIEKIAWALTGATAVLMVLSVGIKIGRSISGGSVRYIIRD